MAETQISCSGGLSTFMDLGAGNDDPDKAAEDHVFTEENPTVITATEWKQKTQIQAQRFLLAHCTASTAVVTITESLKNLESAQNPRYGGVWG